MKHIIREIEISKVTGEKLTGDAKVIQDWFDKTFNKIEFKKLYDYPGSIFFVVGDNVYFEQDNRTDQLWCHYSNVWLFFKSNFSSSYQKISDLIKYMMEQQLKCKVDTPEGLECPEWSLVEQQLKCKVGTQIANRSKVVEQQLKCKVDTPCPFLRSHFNRVEQHLKYKVGTPRRGMASAVSLVEQQLKSKAFKTK